MGLLQDKAAIVTGASSGIGEAIGELFVAEGTRGDRGAPAGGGCRGGITAGRPFSVGLADRQALAEALGA